MQNRKNGNHIGKFDERLDLISTGLSTFNVRQTLSSKYVYINKRYNKSSVFPGAKPTLRSNWYFTAQTQTVLVAIFIAYNIILLRTKYLVIKYKYITVNLST